MQDTTVKYNKVQIKNTEVFYREAVAWVPDLILHVSQLDPDTCNQVSRCGAGSARVRFHCIA
jgi:hypothetical protein